MLLNLVKMSQKLCTCRSLPSAKLKFFTNTRNFCHFSPRNCSVKDVQKENYCPAMSSYKLSNSVLRPPFRRFISYSKYLNNGPRYSAANILSSGYENLYPIPVSCGQLRKQDVGTQVRIKGRITIQSFNRFAQLKDHTGVTQIQIPDMRMDLLRRISNMPNESIVTVVGTVRARPESKVNITLDTGEVEVIVTDILDVILNRKRKRRNFDLFTSHLPTFNQGRSNPVGLTLSRSFSTAPKLTSGKPSLYDDNKLAQEFPQRTHKCSDLNQNIVGQEVTLCGWLTKEDGQRLYLTIQDDSGIARLSFPCTKEDNVRAKFQAQLSEPAVVEVIGTLCSGKMSSTLPDSKNIEVVIKEVKVLDSKSETNESKDVHSKETQGSKMEENVSEDSHEKLMSRLEATNDYTTRTHTCGELRSSDVGKEVKLYGWIEFVRMNKFILLRDVYGTTQIIIENPEKSGSSVKEWYLESVLCVTGKVCARPASQVAEHLATGEVEVLATSVQVINKAIPKLPFHIREWTKVNHDTMNRYRFLALRFPELQNNLRLRSEMLFKMREFLITKKKFVEVETPTLFKKTPGGAQEFIVPTHFKNKFYSLVQSPQQLKQLLMVGSVDRYFQIARCYRDERTNTERQPEFTQLDVELSFTNVDGVIKLTEDVLAASWPSCKCALQVPFPRMRYQDALENYGSDKPCILDKFLIKDMKDCIQNGDDKNVVYMFVIPDGQPLHRKLKTHFDTLVKESAVKVYVVKIPSEQKLHQDLCRIVPGFQPLIFENCFSVKQDDLLVLAKGPRKKETLEMLGLCRHHVIDELNLINEMNEKEIYDFRWIIDFPLFEQDEGGELKSTHHPFTQPHPEDLGLIPYEAVKARSLAYDLVLNGSEIGGGSIRIHNVQLQETILKLLGLQEDDFSHLLEAFRMGCPPHGGIALGIDRLMAILCNQKSIKDVIAFPKATDGQDIMTGCPCDVPVADKIRYHIPWTDDEREEPVDSSPYHRQSEEEI